ncbi:MAG TPA: biotin/lipoyl-containing protein [Chloroflexota bacterium]|nr:biotin/lipoyl-containing protein [Chloroflexota bacterium]
MSEQAGWLATVRRLLAVIHETDIVELHYQGPALRLRLHRQPGRPPGAAGPAPPAGEQQALHVVRAPLTGVFYAAPAPQAEPYVREGDWVEPGKVVGLIETMKVFNEVHADTRGRVVRVHVRSGQLVHQDEPLLTIDPQAAAPGQERP